MFLAGCLARMFTLEFHVFQVLVCERRRIILKCEWKERERAKRKEKKTKIRISARAMAVNKTTSMLMSEPEQGAERKFHRANKT